MKTFLNGELSDLQGEFSELNYEVTIDTTSTREEIQAKIENKEITEAIVLTEVDGCLNFEYLISGMSLTTSAPTELISLIEVKYQNMQLARYGISENRIQVVSGTDSIQVSAVSSDEDTSNIITMMLLSIALFYAIYFYAFQVSNVITMEKTSRIIETLVTSTSPRIIVLGKTIGIGIVGIIQTLVTVLVAYVGAVKLLPADILETAFSALNFNQQTISVIIVYYLLGYSLYAMLYALTGSMISKPEEVQSANTPVALLAVIGFLLSYFTMMNPTSELNQIAAIIPISSPFCMPFRVIMGLSDSNELGLSILLLVITILVVAKISIKIYSSAILNYGGKRGLKKMLKEE